MVGLLLVAAIQGPLGCAYSDACDPFSEDFTECDGSRVMVCKRDETASDGYDWTLDRDCSDAKGMMCQGGECRPAPGSEPCPDSARSVCRENDLLDCIDGRVAQTGTDCSQYGQVCHEIVAMYGTRSGACALDKVGCPNGGETSWDCRDGVLFECSDGRTRVRVVCENSAACVVEDGIHSCPESAAQQLELRWRGVPGGTFRPGSLDLRTQNAEVSIDAFEMMEREVTAAAYQRCVDSNVCDPTLASSADGVDDPSNMQFEELPVASATWDRARRFCWYVGGRLPSGHEWEYAMRNAGRDIEYPWGSAPADCHTSVLALPPSDGAECPSSGLQPGCSRQADITEQGICDLVGNLTEITEGGNQGGNFTTTDEDDIYHARQFEARLGFRCIRDRPE